MDKYEVLKDVFGHDSFREGQEEIIDALCSGRDVACIMPTGAGKSMCYQIPALMSRGVTIVISPLVSLMHDQVMSLVQSGVAAAYINSMLSVNQTRLAISRMREGRYKIIYAAPERLESESFLSACHELEISMVAVDEAHCVSHWGKDFRPSYRRIADFIKSLPSRPTVGAFTATATQKVRDDIVGLLALNAPLFVTTGFDRPNLNFSVLKPDDKDETLLRLINDRRDQSGIVYCSTRKNVENVCDFLNAEGVSAVRYHAGLSDVERRENQENFVYDRASVVVATNAFGMGIDKSNVSYVIHYNMPMSLEGYYQEAGRAGRDGSEADCILLYSPSDVRTARFLIENSEVNEELSEDERAALYEGDQLRLKMMTFYCTTGDCLRHFMLDYFGEKSPMHCGKCSNCSQAAQTDVTNDAKSVLFAVRGAENRSGRCFGIRMISNILRGVSDDRIERYGFDKLSEFGSMNSSSEKRIRSLMSELIAAGYLEQTADEYPVLRLTASSNDILESKTRFTTMEIDYRKRVSPKTAKTAYQSATNVDPALFNRLKELRKQLAKSISVPAYVIFTDAVLTNIAAQAPQTRQEFSKIKGVGVKRSEKYADIFIKEIKAYKSGT